jgi:hypothetical protein
VVHLHTIRQKRQGKEDFQNDEKSLCFAQIVNYLAEEYVRKKVGNHEERRFDILVSNLLTLSLNHSNQKKSGYCEQKRERLNYFASAIYCPKRILPLLLQMFPAGKV